jgi:hypothetical protein
MEKDGTVNKNILSSSPFTLLLHNWRGKYGM